MATTPKREVPFIALAGTPHERGVTHGETTKQLIEKNIAFYKKLLKLDDSIIREQSRKFAQKMAAFRPALVEEMNGIAEGAGVDAEYIYMINARTELLSMSGEVQSECATFFFAPNALLFENWDWSEPSRELTVLLSIKLDNGNTILTFAEAGMLGKVGMSSAGFGVAFNYLYPDGPLNGLPIHALLRSLLEASSFDEATEMLSTSEYVGTSGNILLADASGRAADYELSGTKTTLVPLSGQFLVHTNHYLGGTANDPEAGAGFLHNSFARYARAQEIISNKTTTYDLNAAKALLLDREAGDGMLCRDFIPEDPGDMPSGTIASIIMSIKTGDVYIASEPQQNPEFVRYQI